VLVTHTAQRSIEPTGASNELMQPPASRSRLGTVARIGASLFLLGLLGGCLLPPDPATEAAQDVFNLYLLVLALAAIVFIGVEGFILYAIFRYRRKPGDNALPPQLHGNTTIEIVWTAIPTVIVMILFVFSMITLNEVEARSDDPGVTIQVDGFQWQWTFRYPEGVNVTGSAAEPPVLAVPVGEPVRLVLNSLDVNHAFYVPQFLIKRDLIPVGENGTPNELEFTVAEAGTYSGQCAEFCGTAHSDMIFTVEAMERAAYDEYIAALASGSPPPSDGGDCATTIQVAAIPSLQFDTDAIQAPAGEAFCIELTNNDTAPHDIGIDAIDFNGEDVPPGEARTYLIPAMDAGDYQFHCTLHPTMVGDLTVGE
jgi:cytochrome c oxidase subunit II